MDYKYLNDYELVYQVRENDEIAYNMLIKKYSNLVGMIAKKYLRVYNNIGLEYDDLYQEGMMGVVKALNDYNASDTLFYTYASLCAKREMERLIKSQRRKKRMVFNDSISLNQNINNDPDYSVGDLIASNYNLEDEYEAYDRYKRILERKFDFELIDSSILELKANGFSIREIAKLLELTYKAVDYRLRKIRKIIVNYTWHKKYYDKIMVGDNMETLKDHLTYEPANLDELPNKFRKLSETLELIHSKGAVVSPLNSETTLYDSPEFIALKRPMDPEREKRKNVIRLAKLMVGCFISNQTGFKDFSEVPTDWFKDNEEEIFNWFHQPGFDKEYFSPLFENDLNEEKSLSQEIAYYHVYLKRKEQAEKLKGTAIDKSNARTLAKRNGAIPYIEGREYQETNVSNNIAAKLHLALNPFIIGLSIAILTVITIMIILLN